jgi:diguanylate cyclase (GGDEF)-like protein/PAS domain S-box-containing protein
MAAAQALRGALLDSRQRWRDLVGMANDLAFETDQEGRLVFVAPDPVLGWSADALLGQSTDTLLAEPGSPGTFNPFRTDAPVRHRRVWLKRADGVAACFGFAAVPLHDAHGAVIGARGVAHDVTEQDARDAVTATALRRADVLDHVLACMRREVLAPRMMSAGLEALASASASEGVAVVDLIGNGIEPTILHLSGTAAASVIPGITVMLQRGGDEAAIGVTSDGRPLLACPAQTRFGEQVALVLWRAPGSRPWDADDETLVTSGSAIVRVILEHDAIQREMARQARTDPLTGLLNRRAFLDELARRIDRLEAEGMPGALLFVDLDNFKVLNDLAGHDAGDEALRLTAQLLRAKTRPTDLVARLGGDEFAVWLDGADEFSAAERAERLRAATPPALQGVTEGHSPPITMSIGIAARWPGHGEDVDTLLNRADQAMYAVKRSGRGTWRLAGAGGDI